MKKNLLLSILGIAISMSMATSSRGQGRIRLDNYDSSGGGVITYGGGFGPGIDGTGLRNGTGAATWTVGFYYALGDVIVAPDPTYASDPSTLGPLTFASGSPGDTTTFMTGFPGYFQGTSDAVINGFTSGVITLEMVVYSDSSYDTSNLRSHSSAFTITPATGPNEAPLVGAVMPAFGVYLIPEPSMYAFAGLSLAAVFVRRATKLKKSVN
jgi:hypothetical protein